MQYKLARWFFLGIFLLLIAAVLYFHLYRYLSFQTLQHYRNQLIAWTTQHYVLTVISFIVIYMLAVALSVPGAIFLTLTGGFLFGMVWGTFYVVIGATLGAILIFLLVKSLLGEWLAKRAHGWIAKMEQGFRQNAFSYLLMLRLIPIFPFWLVNIVPALLNVKLRTFIYATALGIIPGSFVYAWVGHGMGYLLDRNQAPNLGIILTPPILLPLLALALLSLVPVIYQRWQGKKHE